MMKLTWSSHEYAEICDKDCGWKLVTVPEYSDPSSSRLSGYSLKSTYPWGTFEPVASHKIGKQNISCSSTYL